MLTGPVSWIAVGIVAITSTGLLLTYDWRWNLLFLGAQYLGASVLCAMHLPLGVAAAKLITGWMAVAALGMTLTALPLQGEPREQSLAQGRAFRLFMAGMFFVLAITLTPRIAAGMPGVGAPVIAGSILLAGIGLLHLGTSSQIARIICGLLTVLTGFEILYAALEGAILVAALLAAVTLGLGLVGAYLLTTTAPEEAA